MTHDQSAEQLLELASLAGAEAASVFQSQSQSQPIFFEANRLKQLESIQTGGTALRLWRDGRPGLAVAHGPVEPEKLVERAIALSRLNEPETIELTATSINKHYPNLGETVGVEQLIEWGREAIALVRQDYPDILCSAEWDCEIESTRLVNSLGLDSGYRDTTLSGYLETEWVRGDDFLSISDGQTQRGVLDPALIAERILKRLNWAKENIAPPVGRVPILFTGKAADMLWGTVAAALNGKQVLEGASPWSDRLRTPVMSPLLTVYQAPEEGPFSCPFDDEGVQTRPIVFIEDGILQLFYTDLTTGRVLGSGTTGNGFKAGLNSYPTPGLFNLLVKPGKGTLQDLIQNLDRGLIIDQMLGGGAGISGEFSINVDLGYRIERGEIVGRVKNTMVSGNVYTALKHVLQVGEDADWNGSFCTPSLIVEGLFVTGRSLF
ncbi:modulator of DNA gyrase family protein [Lyngbya aestuarii BL J]|uniref:Modulator of DNA gyrase family protein n=1 Tax=Lyngbya aestuarii BL J TaxID=1348334 RepID=U7QGG6_9CYAN|nr:TldD/PmbA family protein [Lyngbya aestuarii]ERT05516.1 modulator of DNA gyrase family protein [Lyngbya aestuarii BL J]